MARLRVFLVRDIRASSTWKRTPLHPGARPRPGSGPATLLAERGSRAAAPWDNLSARPRQMRKFRTTSSSAAAAATTLAQGTCSTRSRGQPALWPPAFAGFGVHCEESHEWKLSCASISSWSLGLTPQQKGLAGLRSRGVLRAWARGNPSCSPSNGCDCYCSCQQRAPILCSLRDGRRRGWTAC